jgi:hypothetical protein
MPHKFIELTEQFTDERLERISQRANILLNKPLTKDEITKEQLWNLLLEIKKEAIEGFMHDEPFAMSHIYTLVHTVIEEEGN